MKPQIGHTFISDEEELRRERPPPDVVLVTLARRALVATPAPPALPALPSSSNDWWLPPLPSASANDRWLLSRPLPPATAPPPPLRLPLLPLLAPATALSETPAKPSIQPSGSDSALPRSGALLVRWCCSDGSSNVG